MPLTNREFESLLSGIDLLVAETSRLAELESQSPDTGSVGDQDRNSCPAGVTQLEAGVSTCFMLVDYGNEHLSALPRLIADPVHWLTVCTCIRSMLESAARVAWLLEVPLPPQDRVARVLAIRREGMAHGVKLQNSGQWDPSLPKMSVARLEAESKNWPCCKPPTATAMIGSQLRLEWLYRLLSGVAHVHPWALLAMAYVPAEDQAPATSGHVPMTKEVNPVLLAGFARSACLAFARAVWARSGYLRTTTLPLEEQLERAFDRMWLPIEERFWRST